MSIPGQKPLLTVAPVRTFDDSQRYVPGGDELHAEMKRHGCVLIASGCGTGKTTSIRGCLEKHMTCLPTEHGERSPSDGRILMLSTRINHAYNLKEDFSSENLKPVCYLDNDFKTKDLSQERFIILSWEQAFRLDGAGEFDIVILDEIRSGLDKVSRTGTIKDMRCYTRIWDIVRKTKHCIMADADCLYDGLVGYWLNNVLRKQHIVWRMTYRQLKRRVSVLFYTKRDRHTHIMKPFRTALGALAQDEKLLVVAATKSSAKAYAEYCLERNIRFIVYTGDSGKAKQDFKRPDDAWDGTQVVIWNTVVTVGIDPKRTLFKQIFLHTSYSGANWLAIFQSVCRGNRHCGDEVTTIHALLTCQPFEVEALGRRLNGDENIPTLGHARKMIVAQDRACLAVANSALESTRTQAWLNGADGLTELRAHVALADMMHSSGATHGREFLKCCDHQQWPVEIATDDPVVGELVATFMGTLTLDERLTTQEGSRVLRTVMVDKLKEMPCATSRGELVEGFMDKSDAQFCAKHKNEDDHIQSHQRTVYDTAASSLYHLLRDISHDDLERVLVDDTLFQSLIRHHDKIELLVTAVYQRKTDVERSLAHSLAAASSHVGLDGHSTRHGNAHFAWQVLCRCMHANTGVLANMTAPDSIIEALNRQVRNEPPEQPEMLATVRQAASLVGLSADDRLWANLKALVHHFGLKLQKKRKREGDRRDMFASITVRVPDEIQQLVSMWTLYDTVTKETVSVRMWPTHRERVDDSAAESAYQREMEDIARLTSSTAVSRDTGALLEVVDGEALRELMRTETSRLEELNVLSQKYTDICSGLKRLQHILDTGAEGADGAITNRVTYHQNYAVGREVVDDALVSLQLCPRAYRGPLAAGHYHDLDMENCHYLIMVQIAEQHGTPLECVRRYVDTREQCLKSVCEFYDVSRRAAKDLFLSVLNGGKPWAWMDKFNVSETLREHLAHGRREHHGLIQDLQREYRVIRDILFKHEAYAPHVDGFIQQIKRNNPDTHWTTKREDPQGAWTDWTQASEEYEESIRRSAFSNLLQDQERLCLDAIITELGKQGYEVGCKIFDGCLVRRKEAATLPASLVKACETAVLRDTGLAMPLWEKCLICGEKLKCCSCK